MSREEMQDGDGYYGNTGADNPCEGLHGPRPLSLPRAGSFVIYEDIEEEEETEQEGEVAEREAEGEVKNIEEQLDEIISDTPVLERTRSRVRCRTRNPPPYSYALSQRQWLSGGSSLFRHRKKVQRTYQSTTANGGRNMSLELEDSMVPPPRPLSATPQGPPPSPEGESSPLDMEEDCSEWEDLDLNQGIDTIAAPPYGSTLSLLSQPSLATPGYVYSSIDKENTPGCNGPRNFDSSEEDTNVDSMDISLLASPCPLRTPEQSACFPLSPVTSPPLTDTTNSAITGEGSDSEGSEGVDSSLADLEYQRLKPRNLRNLHASIMSLIDRDCSCLIKHGLLPHIHPTYPGSSIESIHTVSLHFQNHLRSCISSFRTHLITWQTVLQSCLTTPPRKRKIILPRHLTLVPSFTRLVLELNIRVNTSAVSPSQPACTQYNTDTYTNTNTNTNTNITTAQPTSSGKKPARTCPPDPITPNYALSKLALAELCIAAYLSEAETYEHKLSPPYSNPGEHVRRNLLRQTKKEAEPSVGEANTCCTEMWKGQWGVLDSGEHVKVSYGSRELEVGTGARGVVGGREKKTAIMVGKRGGKRNVCSGGVVPAGKKKRDRKSVV